MPKKVAVCAHCKGSNVLADAYAVWSVEDQRWELQTVFDKGHYCNDCGGECSIEMADAPEGT